MLGHSQLGIGNIVPLPILGLFYAKVYIALADLAIPLRQLRRWLSITVLHPKGAQVLSENDAIWAFCFSNGNLLVTQIYPSHPSSIYDSPAAGH